MRKKRPLYSSYFSYYYGNTSFAPLATQQLVQWLWGARVADDGVSVPDRGFTGTRRDALQGVAVDFDGVNSFVSIPHSAALTFGNGTTDQPFSVSAWVNADDWTNFRIFSKGDLSNVEWQFGSTFFTANDQFGLQLFDSTSGNYIARRTNTLTAYEGQDLFIVATYTGSKLASGIDIQIYNKSGVVVEGDAADAVLGVYNGMDGAALPQYIGRLQVVNHYANGRIWDVRVHNSVLTSDEITEVFYNRPSGHEVGSWLLDENAGTSAFDRANESEAYISNFSAGADGFLIQLSTGGTVVGNIDGINGRDNVLRLTVGTDNNFHTATKNLGAGYANKKYRIEGSVYIPSGQTIDGFTLAAPGGGTYQSFQEVAGDWYDFSIVATLTSDGIRFIPKVGAGSGAFTAPGDVLYISDVRVTQIAGNNHGTYSGGYSFVRQNVFSAQNDYGFTNVRYFDGVDDYASIPHSESVDVRRGGVESPFSISFRWVHNSATSIHPVFWKGGFVVADREIVIGDIGASAFGIILYTDGSNNLGRYILNLTSLVQGRAYTAVITYDGSLLSSGLKVLIYDSKGVLVDEDDTTLINGVYTGKKAGTSPYLVNNNSSSTYFLNTLFDVRFFTHELSAQEITSITQENIVLGTESAYYKLNDESTTIAADSVGSNDGTYTGTSKVRMPVKIDDISKDISNHTAQYTGDAPIDGLLVQSACIETDGVSENVSYGNIGTITTLFLRVRLVVDNQYICSLADTTATAIHVAAGVLTFGASLGANTIQVDGATVSAASAGATLNDNNWHTLQVTFSVAQTASNFKMAKANTAYGNIQFCNIYIDSGATLNAPCAEGAGNVSFDTSGNGYHGTITGSVW